MRTSGGPLALPELLVLGLTFRPNIQQVDQSQEHLSPLCLLQLKQLSVLEPVITARQLQCVQIARVTHLTVEYTRVSCEFCLVIRNFVCLKHTSASHVGVSGWSGLKVVAIHLLQVQHEADFSGFKDGVAFCCAICIRDQRSCLEMESDHGLYLDAAACGQLSQMLPSRFS